jgi:hypothetical protein
MKECKYHVKSGKDVIAEGVVRHENGKSLDTIAINAAASVAKALGILPEVGVTIWREKGKDACPTGHKRAELRPKAKADEFQYKAVAV